MESDQFTKGFYKFSITFAKLAYLNLVWLLFTILGLGVFGFFPSTVAMYSTIRQWIKGNKDFSLFHNFWKTYKKEFLKSNGMGLIYMFIGLILYIDILYFSSPTHIVSLILYYFFWIVTFVYILFGFFLFPVYVHYENKWWRYFQTTFSIMLMNPLTILAFLVVITGWYAILSILPGLIPFFSGSGLAYILMLISYKAFDRASQNILRPNQRKSQTAQT